MTKAKIIHSINIILIVGTGLLALLSISDLLEFIIHPEGYSRLIGEGSSFGCHYQTATNYIIFSVAGTISMIIAFVSGFSFEDERKSIFARIFFIIAAYAVELILSAIMCP